MQITDLWNQFVPLLKRAADMVSHQLPSMVDTLDNNFSTLASELENLVLGASSEPYLDPDQNAKEMLVQLNELCSQFYVIAKKLHNQSRASGTIRGENKTLGILTTLRIVSVVFFRYNESQNIFSSDFY